MITTLKQDLFNESQYPLHKLGQLAVDQWGSKFRYVQAGASALVTGNLLQEAAEDTNFRSMAVDTAAAIGTSVVSVTLGGTAVTANQFDGGQLLVESAAGIGQLFRILSHEVQTSTSGSCNFTVDRPLKIALTTSSQVSIRLNSFDGVIQFPTTQTGAPVGVALYAMTAVYHGWVQSGGDGAVLQDTGSNTSADNTALEPSQAVAGSVKLQTAGGVIIGHSREVINVDSTMGFAFLILD